MLLRRRRPSGNRRNSAPCSFCSADELFSVSTSVPAACSLQTNCSVSALLCLQPADELFSVSTSVPAACRRTDQCQHFCACSLQPAACRRTDQCQHFCACSLQTNCSVSALLCLKPAACRRTVQCQHFCACSPHCCRDVNCLATPLIVSELCFLSHAPPHSILTPHI